MTARLQALRGFGATTGHTEPSSMPAVLDDARLDSTEGAALIDTTRRYPRTMHGIEAAFPRDAAYARSGTKPSRLERDWTLVDRGCAVLLVVFVLALLTGLL